MSLGVSECPFHSAAITPARTVGAGGGERFAAELVDGLAHDGAHFGPFDLSGLGGCGEPLGDEGGDVVEPAVDNAQSRCDSARSTSPDVSVSPRR
ncbi:hypothetical protein [Streptomyces sp. NPDC055287]